MWKNVLVCPYCFSYNRNHLIERGICSQGWGSCGLHHAVQEDLHSCGIFAMRVNTFLHIFPKQYSMNCNFELEFKDFLFFLTFYLRCGGIGFFQYSSLHSHSLHQSLQSDIKYKEYLEITYVGIIKLLYMLMYLSPIQKPSISIWWFGGRKYLTKMHVTIWFISCKLKFKRSDIVMIALYLYIKMRMIGDPHFWK